MTINTVHSSHLSKLGIIMTETVYQKITEIARDAELNFSDLQISVMLSQIIHQGFAHKCAKKTHQPC